MTPSRRPALHPATGLGFRRQEARGGQRHLQETKPPKDGGPWGPGRVWGLCGLTRSHSQGRQDSRAPTFKLEAGPPSPSHHGSSLLPRHWPWHQAPAPGTDPPPSRQPHAWPCPGRPQQFGTGLGEGAARCKALPPKGPEGTVWAAGEEEGAQGEEGWAGTRLSGGTPGVGTMEDGAGQVRREWVGGDATGGAGGHQGTQQSLWTYSWRGALGGRTPRRARPERVHGAGAQEGGWLWKTCRRRPEVGKECGTRVTGEEPRQQRTQRRAGTHREPSPPQGPASPRASSAGTPPSTQAPTSRLSRQPSQKAAQAQPGPADGVGPRVCTLRPGLVLKGSLGPVDLGLDTALALCYTDRNTNGPETAVRGRRELTHQNRPPAAQPSITAAA